MRFSQHHTHTFGAVLEPIKYCCDNERSRAFDVAFYYMRSFFPTASGYWASCARSRRNSDRAPATDKGETDRQVQQSVCLLLESAAHANELPVEFFVRLIWQESRFRPTAIGPRTRSGRHALGIAQFMPATAAERNLLDPTQSDRGVAEGGRIPKRVARPVR
jgi:soluble lytic murein transglycosylase-like protein